MGPRSLREGAGEVGPTPAATHRLEGVSRLWREKRDEVVLVDPLVRVWEIRWLAAMIQSVREGRAAQRTLAS